MYKADKTQRIAVINPDKCKPKKCTKECKKKCPVNAIGKRCIDIEDIAVVTEVLCIGCNQCVKSLPL
jgi:ATP-binding cassette subfamily E protein 1